MKIYDDGDSVKRVGAVCAAVVVGIAALAIGVVCAIVKVVIG